MRAQTAIPCLLILVGLRTATFAQALIEHAAVAAPAAAGSSTGAMIGSKLSATLEGTVETGNKAPRTSDHVRTDAKPGAMVLGGSSPVQRGPQVVWTRGMEHRAQLIHNGPPRATAAPIVSQQSVARVSTEDIAARLAAVKPGMARQDVLARLGAPSYTIAMIGDDGRQIERMRFRAMGEDLATVEVRDGVVASVTKRVP